jgi:hypothetical protein
MLDLEQFDRPEVVRAILVSRVVNELVPHPGKFASPFPIGGPSTPEDVVRTDGSESCQNQTNRVPIHVGVTLAESA